MDDQAKYKKETEVLKGMVHQFTLENGKAPANHSYYESIIKHLKQKLGFTTLQVAAVPEDYCKDQDWEEAPLDPVRHRMEIFRMGKENLLQQLPRLLKVRIIRII